MYTTASVVWGGQGWGKLESSTRLKPQKSIMGPMDQQPTNHQRDLQSCVHMTIKTNNHQLVFKCFGIILLKLNRKSQYFLKKLAFSKKALILFTYPNFNPSVEQLSKKKWRTIVDNVFSQVSRSWKMQKNTEIILKLILLYIFPPELALKTTLAEQCK